MSTEGEWWLNPDWEAYGRVHNWRNYINAALRAAWFTFTPEQRRLMAENALEQASNEEWG